MDSLPCPARSRRYAWLAGGGSLLLVLAALFDPEPRLVWNLSDSAPRGLYWISRPSAPLLGERVAARLTPAIEEMAARRHYLPRGIPLIKTVAAAQGDEVCASGSHVTLFGTTIATRRTHDPAGRPMPWWTGCRRLGAGEYLLLNPGALSFDGRYFGPSGPSRIIGRAKLLWRW